MTLTTVTVAGIDYQSYASLAEANAILAVDPVRATAWAPLLDPARFGFLVAATHRLDLLPWEGSKTGGAAQATAFPRKDLAYRDGTAVTGVPAALARACALLAGSIAIRPAQADEGNSSSALAEVKAGSAVIKFFRRRETVKGNPLQDETAYALVRQWLSSGVALAGLASGSDIKSSFTDANQYGVYRGL